jgi:MFS family permease
MITRLFPALRHPNFRLFIGGQAISLIGTWMQRVAVGWLVYRLTGSALLLGVVGFVSQIPTFFLAPFAGVVADRMDRRRVVIATQALAGAQALLLALLVISGHISVWHIITLSTLLGISNAFDVPARQSFLHEMLENKADLGNAIALNSTVVNAGRLIGPSIAGILIAVAGEGVCFACNAVSYGAVIIALLCMKITGRPRPVRTTHVLQELTEGIRYAGAFLPIRNVLLFLALISLVGMPYTVLMPVFARDILHSGPHGLGFLMGGAGAGALAGALYLASRRNAAGLERLIPTAATIFGCALIAFSLSRVYWLSLSIIPLVGFGMMVQMASSNTLVQVLVDDDKRGRVMSLYAMAFMGMAPFGSLMAGSLAKWVGAPRTVLIGGVCSLCGTVIFVLALPAMRKFMRPEYRRARAAIEAPGGIAEAEEQG